jgi:hypothetical protein
VCIPSLFVRPTSIPPSLRPTPPPGPILESPSPRPPPCAGPSIWPPPSGPIRPPIRPPSSSPVRPPLWRPLFGPVRPPPSGPDSPAVGLHQPPPSGPVSSSQLPTINSFRCFFSQCFSCVRSLKFVASLDVVPLHETHFTRAFGQGSQS